MSQRDRVQLQMQDEQSWKKDKTSAEQTSEQKAQASPGATNPVLQMQRTHGNRAVRRMLYGVQRDSLEEGGPLSSDISSTINSKRGSGSALDGSVQAEMSESMNFDFSNVKVHTDSESQQLNQNLGAKAFTTGSDIFFSEGAYQPGSSEGKELLAHELTHVVQQGGNAPSGDLTLGPAGDSYESEADSVASAVTSGAQTAQAKRDPDVQRMEEEEMMQAKRDPDIQRMEEEEMMQAKRDPDVQRMEEEEMMQAKRDPDVQRMEEEEMMQAKRDPDVQRMEEEEEMMQAKRDPDIQRMEEEEEMMQAKRDPDIQRMEDEEMMQG